MVYDVLVIGGGVIGCMTARELSKYRLLVCVAEKQNDVAVGATKANSGIIHGGYDPVPNTLKAELNAKGVEKLFEAAEMLNVPYRKNGFTMLWPNGSIPIGWRRRKPCGVLPVPVSRTTTSLPCVPSPERSGCGFSGICCICWKKTPTSICI